ncbi:MAG: hypothetical protein PHE47_08685 [Oscillospiraceae bacterium]|nr:hypothetical protein [Oscillospiraceae bacterium]
MQSQKKRVGGFVAENSGLIRDCYSILKLQDKKRISGGFVGQNNGSIAKSYAFCPTGSLKGGFLAANTGNIKDCFFFHNEAQNDRRFARLADTAMGRSLQKLRADEDFQTLGFDLERMWQRTGSIPPLGFTPENWRAAHEKDKAEATVFIGTARELLAFAGDVNAGDTDARSACVCLTADINLGGKEWTPIGTDRSRAFTGLFLGGGHTVSNFKIQNKGIDNKGFFGFFRGSLYDLTVDCLLGEGPCCGGIAAYNEGEIRCCAALVSVSNREGLVGGLVGVNEGEVTCSYAAGRLAAAPPPLIPILLGTGMLALLTVILVLVPWPWQNGDNATVFAPVPYDEDQVPISGDSSQQLTPRTDGNFVSFQFEREIDVNLDTGKCTFNFKNPGDSNHNIVVQLQFTDAQAIRVMGSTGRTSQEQQALEAMNGYSAETYRTIIAESGAIRPGYELSDLRLTEQPNGAVIPPGTYNAMVYLLFYDINTNNRAMLESQLPVEITVH